MSRRRKVGIAVALVVVAAALTVWLWPVKRAIVGVAPLDGDQAIVVTSHAARRSRSFVQMVTTDGATRWVTETTPFVAHRGLDRYLTRHIVHLVADGTRVFVLARRTQWRGREDVHEIAVLALQRETGERLWQRTVASGVRVYARTLFLHGSALIVRHGLQDDATGGETLTALDPRDGQTVWSAGAPPSRRIEYGAEVVPTDTEHLVLTQPSGLREPASILDARSGRVVGTLPLQRVACVLPDGVLGFAPVSNEPTFVPRTGDAFGAPRRLGAAGIAFAPPSLPWGAPICGAYGDLAVMEVRAVCDGCDQSPEVVGFDRATGALRWRAGFHDARGFEGGSLRAASLPRMLPVVVARTRLGRGPTQRALAILDLTNGAVLRRFALSQGFHFVVASSDDVSVRPVWGDEVVQRFHPATGDALPPLEFPRGEIVGRENDVQLDRLWWFGRAPRSLNDLPFQVVEPSSGRMLHRHGLHAD